MPNQAFLYPCYRYKNICKNTDRTSSWADTHQIVACLDVNKSLKHHAKVVILNIIEQVFTSIKCLLQLIDYFTYTPYNWSPIISLSFCKCKEICIGKILSRINIFIAINISTKTGYDRLIVELCIYKFSFVMRNM